MSQRENNAVFYDPMTELIHEAIEAEHLAPGVAVDLPTHPIVDLVSATCRRVAG